jgi:hypothetical protein
MHLPDGSTSLPCPHCCSPKTWSHNYELVHACSSPRFMKVDHMTLLCVHCLFRKKLKWYFDDKTAGFSSLKWASICVTKIEYVKTRPQHMISRYYGVGVRGQFSVYIYIISCMCAVRYLDQFVYKYINQCIPWAPLEFMWQCRDLILAFDLLKNQWKCPGWASPEQMK